MEQLETFLNDTNLRPEEREVLWTLLAHALRASAPPVKRPLVKISRDTTLSQLLEPFLHFLDASATRRTAVGLLEKRLRGHEVRFPFGVLALDASGRITRISAEPQQEATRQAPRKQSLSHR